jgi:hypothetical protein
MGNSEVGRPPARQHTVRRKRPGGKAWHCLPKTDPANKHLFSRPREKRFCHTIVTGILRTGHSDCHTVARQLSHYNMPLTVPENRSEEAATNRTAENLKLRVLTWLESAVPKVGRMAGRLTLCLGAAALLLCGMKSVANHFFPEGNQSEDNERPLPAAHSADVRPPNGPWWEPPSGPDNSYADDQFTEPGTNPLSKRGSVIPVDHGIQFSGGSLIPNSGLPISNGTSREPYQLLGLSTSSFTKTGGGTLASTNNIGSDLSFSLSGDVNLVPVDNLTPGGVNVALVSTPEPSTTVMFGIALGSLVLARRRRPALHA